MNDSKERYFCTLDIEIRNCPFLSKDLKYCNAEPSSCSFRKFDTIIIDTHETKQKYVREPRWYEKYYK